MTDVTDKTETSDGAAPRLVHENTGLSARKLGKRYKKRPVLRDVSLSVQRGEAVGLLGPNGAGKTTCFYIITGLIKADFGQIMLDGHDITSLPMYRRARLGVGYVPEERPKKTERFRFPAHCPCPLRTSPQLAEA